MDVVRQAPLSFLSILVLAVIGTHYAESTYRSLVDRQSLGYKQELGPQPVVTPEQRIHLISQAAPVKDKLQDFWIWVGCSEDHQSQVYAADFVAAFKKAGLRAAYMGPGFLDADDDGIAITLPDRDHPTDLAKLVLDIFNKSGISYRLITRSADYPNPPDMEFLVTPPRR